MQGEIYMAVDRICWERESNGSYRGNSHHLSQEITEAVMQVITARQNNLESPGTASNSGYAAALLKWRDSHIDKLSIPAWSEFNEIAGRLHPPKAADDA